MVVSESRPPSVRSIVAWALAAAVVCVCFGPHYVRAFRPPAGIYLDFAQEWLSAKNYWAGLPVYTNHAASLAHHTGIPAEDTGSIIPWNAHPPASVLLALPFGKLSYQDAHFVWNLATFPLLLVSMWLIVRGLGFAARPWWVFPAIVAILPFNPLYINLVQGQLNIVILFLLTLTWAADRSGRPGLAGLTAGLAAALKLTPAFVFVYFLAARRWRSIATGGIALMLANALALAAFGSGDFRTYISEAMPSVTAYETNWRNISLAGLFLRAFHPRPYEKIIPLVDSRVLAGILLTVSRLAIIGVIGWAAWAARTLAARDRAFAATLVGMVLVSPVAWTQYFVLLVLPIILVCARAGSGGRRAAAWIAVGIMYLPENFLLMFAIGPDQAAALVRLQHEPISAWVNLAVISVFTYALILLFMLVLLMPVNKPSNKITA